jgi:hypothetical protein
MEKKQRAHEPEWWRNLMSHYPQFSTSVLTHLYEYKWFRKFLRELSVKCPFERQIWFKNTLVVYIPALCKFNPFYTQLIHLKVKAISE